MIAEENARDRLRCKYWLLLFPGLNLLEVNQGPEGNSLTFEPMALMTQRVGVGVPGLIVADRPTGFALTGVATEAPMPHGVWPELAS